MSSRAGGPVTQVGSEIVIAMLGSGIPTNEDKSNRLSKFTGTMIRAFGLACSG